MMQPLKASMFCCLLLITFACKSDEDKNYVWKTVVVNVSAYNSLESQTDSVPSIAAWGDTLKPGMKTIAVSRDLMELGLDYNTHVKIEGFEDIHLVKDKMHPKWKRKIDIYMGEDVKKAREWGRKKLKIRYRVKRDSLQNK
ncbi:MAG: hypothetical protein WBN18_14370 [Flavobacteriaceae bacterium]